jgi:hypothetical protein
MNGECAGKDYYRKLFLKNRLDLLLTSLPKLRFINFCINKKSRRFDNIFLRKIFQSCSSGIVLFFIKGKLKGKHLSVQCFWNLIIHCQGKVLGSCCLGAGSGTIALFRKSEGYLSPFNKPPRNSPLNECNGPFRCNSAPNL